jgi:hypothetical protein
MSQSVNTLGPAARGAARSPGARGARGASDDAPPSRTPPARDRAVGAPYREQRDWAASAAFAAGLALGALVGAGAALLTAPRSGVEARLALKRSARQARVRAEDRWDGLGSELRLAARRRKRELRRKVAASRWRAADALDG